MAATPSEKMYFGGVEGGSTASNMIILDEQGKVVAKSLGESTNHWLVGMLLFSPFHTSAEKSLACRPKSDSQPWVLNSFEHDNNSK